MTEVSAETVLTAGVSTTEVFMFEDSDADILAQAPPQETIVYTEPVYVQDIWDIPVYDAPLDDTHETEPVEEEPVKEEPAETVPTGNTSAVSESDFVLLCNAVAHEAGSNWIDDYDKAKVVEVIMNRVYSSLFPNSVFEVLTQRGQFTGCESYVYLNGYSSYVTDSVINSVNSYFNDPTSFQHGYLYFYGDGTRNYFY